MNKKIALLAMTTFLTSCSLAPDFTLPDIAMPMSYKEQPTAAQTLEKKGEWAPAQSLEQSDRGNWWKIFGDDVLNDLEQQAADANQTLKIAAARVEQARSTADASAASFLPNIDIGGNAVRAQPSSASLAAFGGAPGTRLKPYTLYSAQGVASYEADLFGRVRDNERALSLDADAQAATYRSTLLALQADVAQHYFSLRALDAERQLLRETIKMREEAARIVQRRFELGETGEQDHSRTKAEVASINAELIALDRQRAALEHALAVLLGKMPSEFIFAESPLTGLPPEIPAGIPSSLLERRPDIAAAQNTMAAANARIGVARTAFFPQLSLTANGGVQSTHLHDLFRWSSRTWALGQLAGSALTMPIFDSGRNMANLDAAHAAYDESVAAYRQQVLVAFRDVEDTLSDQRLLSDQSLHQNAAAASASRTTDLTEKRYQEGDVDYFEVINAERDSLAAERAAVQIRGQRFLTTIALIRALGGGWEQMPEPAKEEPTP